MNHRARLGMTSATLLVGVLVSACGGGGGSSAPTAASEESFCDAANSLFTSLMPEDMSNPEVPSNEEMAQAVKDWGAEMEKVGTPEGISDDARKGFEAVIDQAKSVSTDDFTQESLSELQLGGADASEAVQKQAEAFSTYLTDTCGSPMDDIEMPELPDLEMPTSTP